MRILWITNCTPSICENMVQTQTGVFGGWLDTVSTQLSADATNTLAILSPSSHKHNTSLKQVSNNTFYGEFASSYRQKHPLEENILFFSNVISSFSPDIIHIWGTEFIHSYEVLLACDKLHALTKTVVSIQGLISYLAKAYFHGIDQDRVPTTIRDYIKRNSIHQQQKNFLMRGETEKAALHLAKHVIGRTDWDYACTTQINPQLTYHFCNETLREPFYIHKWDMNTCEPYSIFVSQCSYPIKGFHTVLDAFSIVLRNYPQAKLYTTGANVSPKCAYEWLKQTSYSQYLYNKIQKHNISDKVFFLGTLNAEEMCQQYCRSNVFVSASSIENSPNSVGEAMLLGVPVISSYVGGVSSLITNKVEGFLYPADEPYMLAYYIEKIFKDRELAFTFSNNARKRAQKTHDKEQNYKDLLSIYADICST